LLGFKYAWFAESLLITLLASNQTKKEMNQMKKWSIALLLFLSGVLSFRGYSAESKMLKANPFIGTWRLITIEYRADDGTVKFPFGEKVTGYIMYNEEGYMAAMLQNNERREFPFRASAESKPDEPAALRREFVGYSGRYEIQEKKIVHHIEICLFTDWIGASERIYEFIGDRLILSTNPFLLDGKTTRTVAVWEKVK
jgi:hypothetical protein